jgi:trehalose synthase-fused probable maltokinase
VTSEQVVNAALSASTSWLTSQRWFGDKTRELVHVEAEAIATFPIGTEGATLIIARCTFATGPDVRYFVPLMGLTDAESGLPVNERDALTDPAFLAWYFTGYLKGRESGYWQWLPSPGSEFELQSVDASDARMMEVEQSNSSILFDRRIMAKIFRRLQPGINPDLEVSRYLTADRGFAHVPRIHGLFQVTRSGETFVLGVLQQFVANLGDGWSWLLSALRERKDGWEDRLGEAVNLLGQRTGELHVALGSDTDDLAFRSELMTDAQALSYSRRIEEELDETIAGLMETKARSTEELDALDLSLRARVSAAKSLVNSQQIRIHGDYHLGQVLRTVDGDFAIIDFEGEPSRTIEQRRQKASPLRDVAGMLRSLDYAIGAITREGLNDAQVAGLRDWGTQARQHFLSGYTAAVKLGDPRLVPQNPVDFRAGLDILEIEKALYEARYELNNRPDWLEIPLTALISLASDQE